ncbi:MAG: hypothetical protein U0R52_03360 [Solirubrobacterales bacterium]
MHGWLPIFFLLVVLKIPVVGAIWLVWWAGRQSTEPGAAEESDGGFRRWRPQPRRPGGPGRGPRSGGARAVPECPPGGRTRILRPPAPLRSRLAHARGRSRQR